MRATRTGQPRALTATTGAVAAVLLAGGAAAQDMEPRLYSNVPVGLNFAIASLSRSSGGLAGDSAIPLQNAHLETTVPTLAFAHAFDAGGKSARFDALWGGAVLSGSADVQGTTLTRDVTGMIDPLVRVSVNLVGAPALSLRQFANFRQDLIIGVNLAVLLPLGQYDPTRLINIGANRWIFRPEIGASKAVGPLTFELGQAISLFTVNPDYFGGTRRSQAPVFATKANIIYHFRPNISAAVQGLYLIGGQSRIDGVAQNDRTATSRIGATLTIGLNRSVTMRVFGNDGISVRTGTNFVTFGTGVQIRWGAGL